MYLFIHIISCNKKLKFIKIIAVLHRPSLLDEKTAEESTSGTEADEESGAVIPNFNDYTEIFRPSRACEYTTQTKTHPQKYAQNHCYKNGQYSFIFIFSNTYTSACHQFVFGRFFYNR